MSSLTGFLQRACAEARERVAEASRLVALDELRAGETRLPPSFAAALTSPGVSLIGELKRASPSRGHLAWIPDPAAHARSYERGGAAALSVLTEPAHFRGTLADLESVARAVTVPVLRKDFLVDPYQVWEARAAGAAAVLLIVAAVGDDQLQALLAEADAAELDALVEVHDEEEAARATHADVAADRTRPLVVGVNARNLDTLTVDHGRFAAVADALPAGALAVAESGVHGPADVRGLPARADGVLVGEHLVTAADPAAAARELAEAVPSPRVRSQV